MKKNFKLVIEYDGTGFYGWQRQADRITIQGELERTLSIILNQGITIAGSGRTDAGVHARGQVASFSVDTRLEPAALKKGVNALMKHPIVLRECSLVDADFHAQYSAVSKEYHYHILNREDPCALGRNYVWHVRYPLDVDAMNQCCGLLRGVHDFKSFENTGSPRTSTVREVFRARADQEADNHVVFKICASGFLKNMVRNLTGTLKDVGTGKMTAKEFGEILAARDRTLAGANAPARGLFLHQVNY